MFKSKKDSSKKEFIEYKDGKIIPVEVEQTRKPDAVKNSEEIPLYQEPVVKKPKEKLITKIKGRVTLPMVKWLIGIALLVFFLFSMIDIYKAFFVEEPNTSIEEPAEIIVSEPKDSPTKEELTVPKETNSEKPKETTTTEKPKKSSENNKPAEKVSSSSLGLALQTANIANNTLITQSSKEIQIINSYIDRKTNKIGLEDQLDKSLFEKESAYLEFQSNQSPFKSTSLQHLYRSTNDRFLSSIEFTKEIQLLLIQAKGSEVISTTTNDYLELDNQLREQQLIDLQIVLDSNDITYNKNEFTDQIEFVLP